jgi:acyl-CoA-binding protein
MDVGHDLLGGSCTELTEKLCLKTNGWNETHNCTCSGQSVQGDNNTMIGAYCKQWTNDTETPWCFVFTGVCDGIKEEPFQGLWKSTGPCEEYPKSHVQAESETLLKGKEIYLGNGTPSWFFMPGWFGYLNLLKVAWMLAMVLFLAACCTTSYIAVEAKYATVSHAEQFEALPVEDRFRWATNEAPKVLSDYASQKEKNDLYGYYNQAKKGDAPRQYKPKVGTPEYEHFTIWQALEGVSKEEAMERYTDLVLKIGGYPNMPHPHDRPQDGGCCRCDSCLPDIFGCFPVRVDYGWPGSVLPPVRERMLQEHMFE